MKDNLRHKYLVIRKNIDNREEKDNIIFDKIISYGKILESDLILTYVSNNDEVDTINIIKYLLNNNKAVAVPKIVNNEMKFFYIKSLDELEKGYFGILEPITNNEVKDFNNAVSITPGICFSNDLYRIGYGKGFYANHMNIYKIGICYNDCLIDIIPNDKHDVKINKLISEK